MMVHRSESRRSAMKTKTYATMYLYHRLELIADILCLLRKLIGDASEVGFCEPESRSGGGMRFPRRGV
jgi:hypothetical protein